MKRRMPPEKGIPAVPLSSESKVLAKFGRLRDFLISTAYDDGSPRQPGEVQISNRYGSLQCMLRDPDSGMRAPIRSMTLDDLLAAVELHLGTDDAPWEVDNYLMAELEKKKKKRA